MRPRSRHAAARHAALAMSGYTLLELMVTLAAASVLAMVATPSLRTFIQNNRLSSASNDLLRSFQLARSEAIKRGSNVVVCASANPSAAAPQCSYQPFRGWIVFQDTDSNWQYTAGEPILERHEALDSSITVKTDNDAIETYAASGFAVSLSTPKRPTSNVVICDVRGNQTIGSNSVERALLITVTGRPRVSTLSTDVGSAASAAGACP